MVPVVTRRVAADDKICGKRIPKDTYLACCLQAVHNSWQQPESWRPERFLPGGEYDSFKEDIRPFMVCTPACCCSSLWKTSCGCALRIRVSLPKCSCSCEHRR